MPLSYLWIESKYAISPAPALPTPNSFTTFAAFLKKSF